MVPPAARRHLCSNYGRCVSCQGFVMVSDSAFQAFGNMTSCIFFVLLILRQKKKENMARKRPSDRRK